MAAILAAQFPYWLLRQPVEALKGTPTHTRHTHTQAQPRFDVLSVGLGTRRGRLARCTNVIGDVTAGVTGDVTAGATGDVTAGVTGDVTAGVTGT